MSAGRAVQLGGVPGTELSDGCLLDASGKDGCMDETTSVFCILAYGINRVNKNV